MQRFDFAVFEHYNRIKPVKVITGSWADIVNSLSVPAKGTKEELPLWGPYELKEGGERRDADIKKLFALVLDYDGAGATPMVEVDLPFQHFLYTTPSSTPQLERYRILVPLKMPIENREDYLQAFSYLLEFVSTKGLDPSSCTFSRSYFWMSENGNYYPKCVKHLPFFEPVLAGTELLDGFKQAAKKEKQEGRNNKFSSMCMAALHKGKSTAKILDELLTFDFTNTPPLFSDPKEPCYGWGKTPEERALKFIENHRRTIGLNGASPVAAPVVPVAPRPPLADLALDAGNWINEPKKAPDELVAGLINAADKVALIGKSKTRKSFLALQLMLSLATGREFLGFTIPKPRKCLLIQFEIKKDNFHSRLVDMADALGLDTSCIGNNLKIINARGKSIIDEEIVEYAKQERFEMIAFDPLYKMIIGDESKIEEVKPLLQRFDKLAETTGAAILYVHHDKKGSAGDQDTTDRGAGSGVLGRDYDSALLLTPQTNEECIGLETVARNHKQRESQTLTFGAGCFYLSDLPFQAKTSRNMVNGKTSKLEDWMEPGIKLLTLGGLPCNIFLQKLNELGCSKHLARTVMSNLFNLERIEYYFVPNKRGPAQKFIKLLAGNNRLPF